MQVRFLPFVNTIFLKSENMLCISIFTRPAQPEKVFQKVSFSLTHAEACLQLASVEVFKRQFETMSRQVKQGNEIWRSCM